MVRIYNHRSIDIGLVNNLLLTDKVPNFMLNKLNSIKFTTGTDFYLQFREIWESYFMAMDHVSLNDAIGKLESELIEKHCCIAFDEEGIRFEEIDAYRMFLSLLKNTEARQLCPVVIYHIAIRIKNDIATINGIVNEIKENLPSVDTAELIEPEQRKVNLQSVKQYLDLLDQCKKPILDATEALSEQDSLGFENKLIARIKNDLRNIQKKYEDHVLLMIRMSELSKSGLPSFEQSKDKEKAQFLINQLMLNSTIRKSEDLVFLLCNIRQDIIFANLLGSGLCEPTSLTDELGIQIQHQTNHNSICKDKLIWESTKFKTQEESQNHRELLNHIGRQIETMVPVGVISNRSRGLNCSVVYSNTILKMNEAKLSDPSIGVLVWINHEMVSKILELKIKSMLRKIYKLYRFGFIRCEGDIILPGELADALKIYAYVLGCELSKHDAPDLRSAPSIDLKPNLEKYDYLLERNEYHVGKCKGRCFIVSPADRVKHEKIKNTFLSFDAKKEDHVAQHMERLIRDVFEEIGLAEDSCMYSNLRKKSVVNKLLNHPKVKYQAWQCRQIKKIVLFCNV